MVAALLLGNIGLNSQRELERGIRQWLEILGNLAIPLAVKNAIGAIGDHAWSGRLLVPRWHLLSGQFAANAAWLVLAFIAYTKWNITREASAKPCPSNENQLSSRRNGNYLHVQIRSVDRGLGGSDRRGVCDA